MKYLKTLTIILSLLIMVAAGHGAGPIVIFEVIGLNDLLAGDFKFNVSGEYADRLRTIGVICLAGQGVLMGSYFFKKKIKSVLVITGCLIILTATSVLILGASDALGLAIFSLVTATPFIIAALLLVRKEFGEL